MDNPKAGAKKQGFWYYLGRVFWTLFLVFIFAPPILYIVNPIPSPGFTNSELAIFDGVYNRVDYIVALRVDITDADEYNLLSGVVIEHEGNYYILTAAHLADPGQKIHRITAYHFANQSPVEYEARLLGYHRPLDVAVLEFTSSYSGGAITMGNASTLSNDDKLIVFGLDLESSNEFILPPELKIGRSLGSYISPRWWLLGHDLFRTPTQLPLHARTRIFISARTFGGYSGGAIVNSKGELVGIVGGYIAKPVLEITDYSVSLRLKNNLSFGTDSDAIKEALPQLINGLRQE